VNNLQKQLYMHQEWRRSEPNCQRTNLSSKTMFALQPKNKRAEIRQETVSSDKIMYLSFEELGKLYESLSYLFEEDQ